MNRTWRPVDILLCGGAAIVGVGAFLPWVKVSAGIFSVTKDGIEGDGVITLITALLVLLAVLTFIYANTPERTMLIGTTIGGIIITAVGVYDWIELEDKRAELEESSELLTFDVSVGAGLVLTVIGGVTLALVAASRLIAKR